MDWMKFRREYVIIVTTQRTSESKRYSCTIETTSRQSSTRAHTALFAFFFFTVTTISSLHCSMERSVVRVVGICASECVCGSDEEDAGEEWDQTSSNDAPSWVLIRRFWYRLKTVTRGESACCFLLLTNQGTKTKAQRDESVCLSLRNLHARDDES